MSTADKSSKIKEALRQGFPEGTSKLADRKCNEKYVGSVLLQKTISEDGYQVKNQGELGRVLIRNHHPAIISDELFEAVQQSKLERSVNVASSKPNFSPDSSYRISDE